MRTITAADLLCPCCRSGNPDSRLLAALNHLQTLIGMELIIHSACRCTKHNAALQGALVSQHLIGQAADITAQGRLPLDLYLAAEQVPLFSRGGIGLYPADYIHVDTRLGRARWFRKDAQDHPITDYLSNPR